jgi:hypothetical protein
MHIFDQTQTSNQNIEMGVAILKVQCATAIFI